MRRHPYFWAYFALCAVCLLWGTTYLGIRMSLEMFSPGMLMGLRYVLSGAILLSAAPLAGEHIPGGREFWLIAVSGVVTLGIGNGALVFAETWIPSGLAALFITTLPFWMTGIEALWPGGSPLHRLEVGGMMVGFLGTILLVWQGGRGASGRGPAMVGFLVLQFGCAGWAVGSIARRRIETRAHPVVTGAIQQLATGVTFLVPSLITGGWHVRPSTRGVAALAYLVVFGSIAGYSAYAYALDRLPVALVSIYNYINPIVAVFLGWLFYREPFGVREAIAAVLILTGVAIVSFGRGHEASAGEPALERTNA